MIHVRLINSKTFGVKMVLLCDKTVLIYDRYTGWYVYTNGYTFYVIRNENGTTVRLHREILGLESGDGLMGDHWNGNGLDNQLSNLRPCSHQENMCNRKEQINNRSGYKGVSWKKQNNKYVAQINHNGEKYYLGLFDTPEEAHREYCKKGKELHGEFFNGG